MRIVIVGAGIGGLSAALALRQAGFDAHVYEQASVLREVGAGVAISPNAVKVLHWLGLAEALRNVGVVSRSMDSRDWQSGALLGPVPLGAEAVSRWGAPFYHLHRANLHDALRAALGDRHLTLGSRCVAVEQSGTTVGIRFADGREADGDLLIGADGIHSVVREHVAGPDRAVWSRQISWRGLAPSAVGHEVGLEVRHHSSAVTDGFTTAQQSAITAGDGPLGIIAGPGCGKYWSGFSFIASCWGPRRGR